MRTITKAPDEEILEGFDWSDRISAGDSLASSTWTLDSGLSGNSGAYNQTSTQVELTGGTAGAQYRVINLVTTSQGEAFQRSFKVQVRDR